MFQNQLKGEVEHASNLMSNDKKIPKSRAKFFQREIKFKKLFDAQMAKWDEEENIYHESNSSI